MWRESRPPLSLELLFQLQLPAVAGPHGWVAGLHHSIEALEVSHISAPGGREKHGLELISPVDLLGGVGSAALTGSGCGLHGAVEGEDKLEVSGWQVLSGEAPQRAGLVEDVVEGQWQDEEGAVSAAIHPEVHTHLLNLGLLSF